MKILWLCHMLPAQIREAVSGKRGSGLWMDHVLSDMLERQENTIRVLCLWSGARSGEISARLSYETFCIKNNYTPAPELEPLFTRNLDEFSPDVIHIWGTEYPHTLAMLRACEARGYLDRAAVSIQGLCSIYALHYREGLPEKLCRSYTFRDFVRQDNIRQQQEKFAKRGANEIEALRLARHVIGRTPWDKEHTARINPKLTYHFCNETLRDPFYTGQWCYETCRKHSIFISSCVYPIKGFHFLLEALATVKQRYPDVSVSVPGDNFLSLSAKGRIREEGYHRYLARRVRDLNLAERIHFLGSLSAEEMKAAFLQANVFALPSTAENSPNSLGEAMLLGVPCVAADVGGVSTLLHDGTEGIVYPSGAVDALAEGILRVFAMEDGAAALGAAAQAHARVTHDPKTNRAALDAIYAALAQ